jgi:phytoene/squalene synthetase
MRPFSIYQRHLEAVSRSFALCIPQLQTPFREQVALAYLLLRVLDTVEDAPFPDDELQARQFATLRRFLREMPSAADVARFADAFPADLSDSERTLIADTHALLQDGHALAAPARFAMFGAIDRMAEGMAAYKRRPSPLRLVDLEDVTRYCCFVAGLVGEMLTRLWAVANRAPEPPMMLAYHFGVFLQKVNILKDQAEDEELGRFFVPHRGELLASLRDHATGALRYIQALPPSERGYRTFCSWSLVMGAATIAALDQPRVSRREDTAKLLAHTAAICHDDTALADLFASLMPPLPELVRRDPLVKPESVDWFRRSLAAPLDDVELEHLGIALRVAS